MFSIKNYNFNLRDAALAFSATACVSIYTVIQSADLKSKIETCTLRAFNLLIQNSRPNFDKHTAEQKQNAMDTFAQKYCKELIDLDENAELLTRYLAVGFTVGVLAAIIYNHCSQNKMKRLDYHYNK